MVPEQPAVGRRKTAIERAAGRHRLLRQAAGAIHGVEDPHAMPVEACRLVELVDEPDFDLLAFFVTQERSWHFAVKTPDGGCCGGLGQQLQSVLARFEDTETVRGWLCTRGQGQHGGERLPQKKTAAEKWDWRHDVLYMRFDRFEPAIGQRRFT